VLNLEGKPAAVYPYAVWWDMRRLKVSIEGPGTGLGDEKRRLCPLLPTS